MGTSTRPDASHVRTTEAVPAVAQWHSTNACHVVITEAYDADNGAK